MAKRKKVDQVLGIMVTSRSVNAVLLESGADGTQVVRRFMRSRNARHGVGQAVMPDLQETDTSGEFTIQFGNGGGGPDNMFLGSEFGALEPGGMEMGSGPQGPATFSMELLDILAECRDAGYPNPTLAFCLSTSEVGQIELTVPAVALSKRTNARAGRASRKPAPRKAAAEPSVKRGYLLELLEGLHNGPLQAECVTFIPMTAAEDGGGRFLAIFPKYSDPVAATVADLREHDGRRLPPIRLEDTEVPLYLGLARAAIKLGRKGGAEANRQTNTLIVRAGSEDTLVMFMEGDRLRQSEPLRSLTAYEAPETICSRVLLLQDEYGIGDVERVLLLSEEREEDLISSFEMFFPDAVVESLNRYVPQAAEQNEDREAAGAVLPAVAAGLRLVDDARYQNVFEKVNLLPKQLTRRRLNLPITWHVIALYVLLFCTVLFFVARYFGNESEISQHHRNIQEMQAQAGTALTGTVETDARILQARIDSMQALHEQYMRALNVLEGLLQGSDQWSRALEETSREVGTVSGIWIENWRPGGDGLQLEGNATSRDNVVQLAERMDASIVSLTFSEIREWPVYSFKMSVELENALPEAARFLREQLVASEETARDSLPVTSVSIQEQN